MAFGNILREARESKGLTPAQVAETTRMLQQIVEDLEVENFKRIAAPIYGRSFIKLYAGLVGLDPAPLLDDFNRLYAAAANEPEPPKLAPVAVPKPVAAPKPIPVITSPAAEEKVRDTGTTGHRDTGIPGQQDNGTTEFQNADPAPSSPEPPETDLFNLESPPPVVLPPKAKPVARGKSPTLPQEKPRGSLRRIVSGAPVKRKNNVQIVFQKFGESLTQFFDRLSSRRPQWGRPPAWILLAGVGVLLAFIFVLYITLGLGRGSRPGESPVSRYVFEPPEFYVD